VAKAVRRMLARGRTASRCRAPMPAVAMPAARMLRRMVRPRATPRSPTRPRMRRRSPDPAGDAVAGWSRGEQELCRCWGWFWSRWRWGGDVDPSRERDGGRRAAAHADLQIGWGRRPVCRPWVSWSRPHDVVDGNPGRVPSGEARARGKHEPARSELARNSLPGPDFICDPPCNTSVGACI